MGIAKRNVKWVHTDTRAKAWQLRVKFRPQKLCTLSTQDNVCSRLSCDCFKTFFRPRVWKRTGLCVSVRHPTIIVVVVVQDGPPPPTMLDWDGGCFHAYKRPCSPAVCWHRLFVVSFTLCTLCFRLCSFIMHTAQDQFVAHVFHCEPSAGALCKTIEAACKVSYPWYSVITWWTHDQRGLWLTSGLVSQHARFVLQLRYQKCLDAHPSAEGDKHQNAQPGKVGESMILPRNST